MVRGRSALIAGEAAHIATSSDVRPAGEASSGFRPDLEGLRAVAVVLVLLYHASVPGFSGGYIGVDVFFVLSGFLITGVLLRELRRTGTVSLPDFYARRARRLLPAAALVLISTVIASALLLPPLSVPDIGGDAAAAALYVSNIRFAVQATDYLQSDLTPSPILHFWSLSVEEQFYLFWPAIVLLVARGRVDAGRRIGIAAGAIFVASLGLAIWLTVANAPWAFFSLPTRAWELCLGAFLAVGAARLARIPDRPAALAAWSGLVMVVASAIVLGTSTPYPGVAALLPTVGSALMIAGGFRQGRLAPGRWLSTTIPRFLGRISYSLYLWHWPLLVIPAVVIRGNLPWWARGALVLIAIGLAAVTQRWVEDPFRHGRRIGTIARRNLAMAATLSLVVATVSLGIGAATANGLSGDKASGDPTADEAELDQFIGAVGASAEPAGAGASEGLALPATSPGPLPRRLRPELDGARSDVPLPYVDGCAADRAEILPNTCAYGVRSSPVTVVLMGDSHALSWFPTMERLARERGWKLLSFTKAGCHPTDIAIWNLVSKRDYVECAAWREATFRRIESERPALVVVSGRRTFKPTSLDGSTFVEGAQRLALWRDGMTRTLDRLNAAADHVVLLADTPFAMHDVPACLSGHREDVLACATAPRSALDPEWVAEERQAAERAGAGFIDPTRWVCPSSPCPAVIGDFLVYRDDHHLTAAFASALASRVGAALPVLSASR